MPMYESVLDYNDLSAGQQFPAVPCRLDDAFVDAFSSATQAQHDLFTAAAHTHGEAPYAPPLCTTLVRFVKDSLGGRWPTGTVHLTQEVRLLHPLRRGDALTVAVQVGQKYVRHDRQYLELLTTTRDAVQRAVVEGRMLLLWAAAEQPATRRSASASDARRSAQDPIRPADGRLLTLMTAHYGRDVLEAYGKVARAQDPIHLDAQYAAQTRFGKNIAQGLLVLTLLSRLMLHAYGESWLTGGTLQVRFLKPVFVDDQVTAHGVEEHGNTGAYHVWCVNQAGVTVISGQATLAC